MVMNSHHQDCGMVRIVINSKFECTILPITSCLAMCVNAFDVYYQQAQTWWRLFVSTMLGYGFSECLSF